MADSQRPPRAASYGILGLVDRDNINDERSPKVGDVPLKLTEERLKAEKERSPRAADFDGIALEAPPARARSLPSEAPGSVAPLPAAPPEVRHIEAGVAMAEQNASPLSASPPLEHVVLQPEPRQASPARPEARVTTPSRIRRRSWALWMAVIALTFALAGMTAYGYLALRQNNLGPSQLPGASAVRELRTQAANAWFEIKDSRLSADLASLGRRIQPAAGAAWQRARTVTDDVYQRYERWRAH
jgi:hypothetical protein